MEANQEYFVFISYSSLDNDWAIWLRDELEHYHLPPSFNGRTDVRENLRKVFRDRDELSAGLEWEDQVKQALANTNNLIVICSPNAVESDSVNKEIEIFISLGKENENHVFPFIVEGNKPEECFPHALKHSKLGGDVNKDGGRDIAFVKVVAGLLEINFSSLWDHYEIEKAKEEQKIREQRDKLYLAQSRYLTEKAQKLLKNGDSYTARLLLLEALPNDLDNPNRPFVPETGIVLREAALSANAIFSEVGGISTMCISADGERIAVATRLKRNNISIWNARNGHKILSLKGHKSRINSLCFNSDGNFLLSASSDAIVSLWNANTGERVHQLRGHSDCVKYAVFYRNETCAISVSNDRTIRIWNYSTGTVTIINNIFKETVNYLSLSPQGEYIAIAHDDNIISILNNKYNIIATLTEHTSRVNTVEFSHNGEKLISASNDGTIRIWNVDNWESIQSINCHSLHVISAKFSHDGKYIVSSSSDSCIIVWNTFDGEEVTKYEMPATANSIDFCLNDSCIVASVNDNTIRILEFLKNNSLLPLTIKTKHIDKVIVSPNENRLFLKYKDGKFSIANIINNQLNEIFIRNNLIINNASFSIDGRIIACTSNTGIIYTIDATNGKILRKYIEDTNFEKNIFTLQKQLRETKAKDSWENIDEIIEDGINEFRRNVKKNIFVVFNPTGEYLVSGNTDNYLYVWDVRSGNIIKKMKGHISSVQFITFSHDGKKIASISKNRIYIWNFETGEKITDFKHAETKFNSLAFSHNDKYLAATTTNNKLLIWGIENGYPLLSIDNETIVNNRSFYSDDSRIISSSLCIRNINDGKIIQQLFGCKQTVLNVFFSINNRQIIAVSNNTIYIWNETPTLQEIIKQTQERFESRPLSAVERKMYYID